MSALHTNNVINIASYVIAADDLRKSVRTYVRRQHA